MRKSVKTHYLDASALVKLFVDEDEERGGRDAIKEYFHTNANFCTTSMCFVEALGVIKRRYFKKADNEKYLQACEKLVIDAWGDRIEIDEVRITRHDTMDEIANQIDFFKEVKKLVKKYGIDYVDALQVLTILRGKYSVLCGDSQSILITADKDLAKAARGEGARTWDILSEAKPI